MSEDNSNTTNWSTDRKNKNYAGKILLDAAKIVSSERGGQNGEMAPSFQAIADIWMVYLNHTPGNRDTMLTSVVITPGDVAEMLSLFKKMRKLYGDNRLDDHYIDDIGYSAIAAALRPGKSEEAFKED